MTPKRYARRLGSHNPTLCDNSTARFFNIFNLQVIGDVLLTGDLLVQKLRHQTQHRELMRCKCLFGGVKRSPTSYFARPLAGELAVKVAVDTSEIT
jgi:hypothetical protein